MSLWLVVKIKVESPSIQDSVALNWFKNVL